MFMAYEGAVKNTESGTDLSEATKDNIDLALHYEKCVTRWHSPLCGCHSCDSDGLALTGHQSLVLRLV
ncbi:hypothetical protein EMIHUDRAFT_253487 [Emiliania huxleyi CCMP1516]|uniref:Uncharacterized protein n=2 Tax=Emiliania huxleyi TaxID=2903 RepID=A0A0D3K7E3_EMIH1|nr:hypothetical protein EMIHUDRAFT_253487 [Emiliania huxleyi CCMP1516]EOD31678.1 hypothetical protein EMIHUDRAFT_253487 [Emiliania huxleyi CCMP1516]|eukprot:XP_005784107.1 hypothetical protein EMIHUDRAFT_253487 [Emiliania huxleyi CCMP1516]